MSVWRQGSDGGGSGGPSLTAFASSSRTALDTDGETIPARQTGQGTMVSASGDEKPPGVFTGGVRTTCGRRTPPRDMREQ